MIVIEPELKALRGNVTEVLELVTRQLAKCNQAMRKGDPAMAAQVIDHGRKIKKMTQAVDQDCEKILALFGPVATDLRFVVSSMKINNDLRTIDRNIESLARFIVQHIRKVKKKFIKDLKIHGAVNDLTAMLATMGDAFARNNTKLVNEGIKKYGTSLGKNTKALKVAHDLIKQHPGDAKVLLRLFALVRILEYGSELIADIGEQIIFHIEAVKVEKENGRGSD